MTTSAPITVPLGTTGAEVSFTSSNVQQSENQALEWDTNESADFSVAVPHSGPTPSQLLVTFIALNEADEELLVGSVAGEPRTIGDRLEVAASIRISMPLPEWRERLRVEVAEITDEGAETILEGPLDVEFVQHHHPE
jgi:hypothetical protein